MADEQKNEPTPTPPTGPVASINEQQVREACAAALEVLNGARSERILALADKIHVAKLVLNGLATGRFGIGEATPATAASGNRAERRATAAVARRSAGRAKK